MSRIRLKKKSERLRARQARNSFEQTIHKLLKKRVPVGASVAYESEWLSYTLSKRYIPDFVVVLPTGRTIYIEAKGYLRPGDRVKMIAVKQANPELDIRFIFAADNKLHKNTETRYSDWCRKHGFPYAIHRPYVGKRSHEIPEDWLSE